MSYGKKRKLDYHIQKEHAENREEEVEEEVDEQPGTSNDRGGAKRSLRARREWMSLNQQSNKSV